MKQKGNILMAAMLLSISLVVIGHSWGPENYMVDPVVNGAPSDPSRDQARKIILGSQRVEDIVTSLTSAHIWYLTSEKIADGDFDFLVPPLAAYSEGTGCASQVIDGPVNVDRVLQDHLDVIRVRIQDGNWKYIIDIPVRDDILGYYSQSCYNPCVHKDYDPDYPNNPTPPPTPSPTVPPKEDPTPPSTPPPTPTKDPTPIFTPTPRTEKPSDGVPVMGHRTDEMKVLEWSPATNTITVIIWSEPKKPCEETPHPGEPTPPCGEGTPSFPDVDDGGTYVPGVEDPPLGSLIGDPPVPESTDPNGGTFNPTFPE